MGKVSSALVLVAALVCAAAPVRAQTEAGRLLTIPVLVQNDPCHPSACPPAPDNRPVIIVRLKGQTEPLYLPVVADTCVKKGDTTPHASSAVELRTGGSCKALFRVDTSAMARDARVERAWFRFTVRSHEKPGDAGLRFYRMLTDWSEGATWILPSLDAPCPWCGPRPGADFDARPLAAYHTAWWPGDGAYAVGGFADAVANWATGAWRNAGFLALLDGGVEQLRLDSREAAVTPTQPPPAQVFAIGGKPNQMAALRLDIHRLRTSLRKGEKIEKAILKHRIAGLVGSPEGTGVSLFRLLRKTDTRSPTPGRDYDPKPIAVSRHGDQPADGWLDLSLPLDALGHWLSGRWENHGALLIVTEWEETRPTIRLVGPRCADKAKRPVLTVRVRPQATAAP